MWIFLIFCCFRGIHLAESLSETSRNLTLSLHFQRFKNWEWLRWKLPVEISFGQYRKLVLVPIFCTSRWTLQTEQLSGHFSNGSGDCEISQEIWNIIIVLSIQWTSFRKKVSPLKFWSSLMDKMKINGRFCQSILRVACICEIELVYVLKVRIQKESLKVVFFFFLWGLCLSHDKFMMDHDLMKVN